MTRRMQHYEVAEWRPWVLAAAVGVAVSGVGMLCQIVQLVVSIRDRAELRDETGDPWDGRSLEWATASPPPAFNFAFLPDVKGEEPYWAMKRRAIETQHLAAAGEYQAIEMPKNSATGFIDRLLCDAHRLRADLAHLVDGRRRARPGLCGLCLVRLARRGRIRNSGERG